MALAFSLALPITSLSRDIVFLLVTKCPLFPSNKGGSGPKFRKAAGGGKVPNLAKANFQRLKDIAALIFTKFLIFIIDF